MSAEDVCKRLWEAHKLVHDKKFNVEEDKRRFSYFVNNHKFIEEHNVDKKRTYYCEHNNLSHLSYDEYKAWLTLKDRISSHQKSVKCATTRSVDLPESFDWRLKNKVTPVKDQGQCGSCWAFSAVGSVEAANLIKTNNPDILSEQQVVDCSDDNYGCNGGIPYLALSYIQENGIMHEKDYEYTATQGTCKFKPVDLIRTTGVGDVDSTKTSLMQAIVEHCPVSIAIDASKMSFQFYKHGVYHDPSAGKNLDHAVLCVGYGVDSGTEYWIVKNSWSAKWGMEGYINIFKDDQGYLGVLKVPCYPTM